MEQERRAGGIRNRLEKYSSLPTSFVAMLSFPVSQPKTKYKTGDQVYHIRNRDSKCAIVGDPFWICCIEEREDGVYYRLKKSQFGELGEYVEESELEDINFA